MKTNKTKASPKTTRLINNTNISEKSNFPPIQSPQNMYSELFCNISQFKCDYPYKLQNKCWLLLASTDKNKTSGSACSEATHNKDRGFFAYGKKKKRLFFYQSCTQLKIRGQLER